MEKEKECQWRIGFLKLNGHAQFSRVGGVFLSFLLRIWSRSHMVSPTVLFLCWGVGNRVLPLGAMISFVQPACLFGPCAARSFGSDSLICRNAKKIGSLDLSPVMVTSDVHEYFLCLPSGGMLNPVEMWSCSLLLADGIWVEVRCVIFGARILWESCVCSPCNCSVSEGKTVNPSI